jgi:hypothetical protein
LSGSRSRDRLPGATAIAGRQTAGSAKRLILVPGGRSFLLGYRLVFRQNRLFAAQIAPAICCNTWLPGCLAATQAAFCHIVSPPFRHSVHLDGERNITNGATRFCSTGYKRFSGNGFFIDDILAAVKTVNHHALDHKYNQATPTKVSDRQKELCRLSKCDDQNIQ